VSTEDQSRNGVRVIVTRSEDGSVVEADCNCFGSPQRVHSNMFCPLLVKNTEVVKDERRATRSAKQAEKDLVRAKEWGEGSSNKAKQESRKMVRDAKRRRSKANRRAEKASIRSLDQ
jgi:hypothetical protein